MKKDKLVLSKSQERVYKYMQRYGYITTLQAFEDLGETRLSARIFELKKKGVKIVSENIVKSNRFNEPRIVAKYKVAK